MRVDARSLACVLAVRLVRSFWNPFSNFCFTFAAFPFHHDTLPLPWPLFE
jgi:hypothetical protein